tara:strand:+ start:90 stop:833 length:744 start_codon:yes stop_codon:yes gene_type:complete
MPITASGQLALSELQTEFGGSNPIAMSEYYRGGAEVDAHAYTTTIPSSGIIAVSDFYSQRNRPPDTNRNIAFDMRYDVGGYSSGTGITAQSSTATPTSFSTTSRVRYYQPVFRAGTNPDEPSNDYILQLNISIHQNEDVTSNSSHVVMYGGATASTATNVVLRWDASSSGGQGGARGYRIDFNSDGVLTGVTNTSNTYNSGLISLVTNSPNNNYKWYCFSAIRPSSIGKGSVQIAGLGGLTSRNQPG